jgi:hypothetical protein
VDRGAAACGHTDRGDGRAVASCSLIPRHWPLHDTSMDY